MKTIRIVYNAPATNSAEFESYRGETPFDAISRAKKQFGPQYLGAIDPTSGLCLDASGMSNGTHLHNLRRSGAISFAASVIEEMLSRGTL